MMPCEFGKKLEEPSFKMNKGDVKKCPYCKFINLPSAEKCDCGYTFSTLEIDQYKS